MYIKTITSTKFRILRNWGENYLYFIRILGIQETTTYKLKTFEFLNRILLYIIEQLITSNKWSLK